MFNWSNKKRFLYTLGTLLFLGVVIGLPIYFKFIRKPESCFDGKLNQNEKFVDCGGVCKRICPDEARPTVNLFSRFFRVTKGVYNVITMIENVNTSVYALRAPYVVKLYDSENVLLNERYGETFIPSSKKFPIIEYTLYTKERDVQKVTFEFLGEINWIRGSYNETKLSIKNQILKTEKGLPRLEADIDNDEVYKIEKIPVVAVVYDNNGNVIASSHTFIDELKAKSTSHITFTWNEVFSGPVGKIEIIPNVIPRELLNQ